MPYISVNHSLRIDISAHGFSERFTENIILLLHFQWIHSLKIDSSAQSFSEPFTENSFYDSLLGHLVPWNFHSPERNGQGTCMTSICDINWFWPSRAKGPQCESSREQNSQEMKGPGSERTRERIGQGPIGWFAPESELAWEQKDSLSFEHKVNWIHSLL